MCITRTLETTILWSICSDLFSIKSFKSLRKNFISIFLFRLNQYIGTYEGFKFINKDTDELRTTFYYPPQKDSKNNNNKLKKMKISNKKNQKAKNFINYDSF